MEKGKGFWESFFKFADNNPWYAKAIITTVLTTISTVAVAVAEVVTSKNRND